MSWDPEDNNTHDPYPLRYGVADIYIDLAATKAIAAEKEGRKIAVEVKSFLGASTISDFHTALEVSDEPDRVLYLAIPTDAYQIFFRFEPANTVIKRYHVPLILYQPAKIQ